MLGETDLKDYYYFFFLLNLKTLSPNRILLNASTHRVSDRPSTFSV